MGSLHFGVRRLAWPARTRDGAPLRWAWRSSIPSGTQLLTVPTCPTRGGGSANIVTLEGFEW